MKNNIICFNSQSSSYGGGSGVWVNNNLGTAPKIIENNTIANNSATGSGVAGIYLYSGTLIVRNNIIWNNSSPLNNQIGGSVTATYNNVQGGYSGAGNINVNPLWADTNFILSNGSPCIDKGDSSIIYNDPPDPGNPSNAKFPAKGTLRNDMGAYGGAGSSLLSPNAVIGIEKLNQIIPDGFNLHQNYPNPFNPTTKIKFDIPVRTVIARSGATWQSLKVSLKIFDVIGREIATLIKEELKAGTYEITFNAGILPSGVYFYKLQAGDYSETKKMILLK
jgi:hypothetical protein